VFASSAATTRRPTPKLLPGDADGELDLTVDAHRTAAGNDIPAKRWHIRRVDTGAAGVETGVVGTRTA
jgi:hypothetical protein